MYYIGSIPCTPSDELQHHGIKGQQWGVKNGPPYPLSKEVSAKVKGSKMKFRGLSDEDNVKNLMLSIALQNDRESEKSRNEYSKEKMLVDKREKKATKVIDKYLRNREKQNLNVDPETGFKLKAKDRGEDYDMKNCNPSFRTFSESSTNNCMLCTTAYDMRRRGYDVIAKRTNAGYTFASINKWYKNAMTSVCTPSELKDILSKQGSNARGNIMVTIGGTGHSMIYELKENRFILRDAQSSRKYGPFETALILGNSPLIYVCRLDNLEINPKGMKEILQ